MYTNFSLIIGLENKKLQFQIKEKYFGKKNIKYGSQ